MDQPESYMLKLFVFVTLHSHTVRTRKTVVSHEKKIDQVESNSKAREEAEWKKLRLFNMQRAPSAFQTRSHFAYTLREIANSGRIYSGVWAQRYVQGSIMDTKRGAMVLSSGYREKNASILLDCSYVNKRLVIFYDSIGNTSIRLPNRKVSALFGKKSNWTKIFYVSQLNPILNTEAAQRAERHIKP